MRAVLFFPLVMVLGSAAGAPVSGPSLPVMASNHPPLSAGDLQKVRAGTARVDLPPVYEDRRPEDLSSAVVGIFVKNLDMSGQTTDIYASGFFVDRCHVLTANHAVETNGFPAVSIKVGWGPRPASAKDGVVLQSPVADLQGQFANVVDARPEWYGASLVRDKDIESPAAGVGSSFAKAENAATSGDWAILTVAKCRPASEPVFKLPAPPFAATLNDTSNIWLTFAGYPKGAYRSLTVKPCLVIGMGVGGVRGGCNIAPGGSGGVLMDRDGVAIGILSIGTDNSQTFVPTEAAAIALSMKRPEPAKPGCVTRMKAAIESIALKSTGKPLPPGYLGGNDDKLTYFGYSMTSGLGQSISSVFNAQSTFFTAAEPDELWCESLIGYGKMAVDPSQPLLSSDVPLGEWHDGSFDFMIAKAEGGPTAGVRIHAREFTGTKIVEFGRMVIVTALKNQVRYSWVVFLYPGKPPLLVGSPGEGFSLPRGVWMERGRAPGYQ